MLETMPSCDQRRVIASLVEALLSVRQLVSALGRPVKVPSAVFDDGVQSFKLCHDQGVPVTVVLNEIASSLGMPKFRVIDGRSIDMDLFDRAICKCIRAKADFQSTRIPVKWLSHIDQIVDEVRSSSFDARYSRREIRSFDDAVLNVYGAGDLQSQPVVLVSACGMPARLCDHWMHFFEKHHCVITWETRWLFDRSMEAYALRYDVGAQASDLFAVMDSFGVKRAHLMGVCGGAVIAMSAAADRPERVSSLSLWHGDFQLGPDSPSTDHQRNLRVLMAMAGTNRASAASVRDLFSESTRRDNGQTPISRISADRAHLVLYPFATSELLYRYAKLNGSIMDTEVHNLLPRVGVPALVVTSADDDITHSTPSIRVAEGLSNATLHLSQRGNHISVFDANEECAALAADFVSATGT